jgi:tetratricopeptide (TPR) repeat protein
MTLPRPRPRLILIIVAALLLALVSPALADEKLPSPRHPDAKAHLDAGNKAYRLREYDQAIKEYRAGAAAETGATYTFWYNLGQAYRQSGKYEDAIWFYSQFLAQSPAELKLHRGAAEDFIAKMRAELDKAATTASPTEPAPTPIQDATPSAHEPTREVAPQPSSTQWYQDRLGWVLVGAGLVGGATSTALVLSGRSLDDEANTEDGQTRRRNLRDRASTRMLAGGIAAGASATVLAIGIVKLVRTPTPTVEERIGLVVDGDGVSFLVRGSF